MLPIIYWSLQGERFNLVNLILLVNLSLGGKALCPSYKLCNAFSKKKGLQRLAISP